MQVFGLQRAVYRGARWSSRIDAAGKQNGACAGRAELVRRWLEVRTRASAAGLAARAPVLVNRAEMIATSFPDFAGFMRALGAEIEVVA